MAADGAVYFGSDDSTFYCLEADGRLRCSWPAGAPIRASPAIGADGTVYFGTFGGRLVALGGGSTGVPAVRLQAGLELAPAIPSPARTGCTVRFVVPPGTSGQLDVLDVGGRRLATLWSAAGGEREREVRWDLRDAHGRRVPAGVYVLRPAPGGAPRARRLVVLP